LGSGALQGPNGRQDPDGAYGFALRFAVGCNGHLEDLEKTGTFRVQQKAPVACRGLVLWV